MPSFVTRVYTHTQQAHELAHDVKLDPKEIDLAAQVQIPCYQKET